MIRTVLFDFDGVLADTLADMLSFSKDVCAQLGHPCDPSPGDLDALDSMDIISYGRKLGLSSDKLEDFGVMMVERFRCKRDPPALFDGLPEVIHQISGQSHLGIVTGNSTQAVQEFLTAHGLDRCFGCVLGADTPGTRRDKIQRAVQGLDGSLAATAMVGDSVSDVRAAYEVGVISVAVTWGHQSEARLSATKPHFLVHSPAELLEILMKRPD